MQNIRENASFHITLALRLDMVTPSYCASCRVGEWFVDTDSKKICIHIILVVFPPLPQRLNLLFINGSIIVGQFLM
jgi:hypothetical protein